MRTVRLLPCGTLLGLLAASAVSGGCSTMNNTEKGVGIGAAAGAGVGTLIGAVTHNPKTGAVVGGLLGGATGGAIGNSMDRDDQKKAADAQATAVAQAQAQANARRLTLLDVAKMTQTGQSDAVIITELRTTGSFFQLSPDDLTWLKAQGVSDQVVMFMQSTRPPGVVVAGPPPVVVQGPPAVVYAQPPPVVYGPPGPAVIVGGYYGGGYRRW